MTRDKRLAVLKEKFIQRELIDISPRITKEDSKGINIALVTHVPRFQLTFQGERIAR